MAKTIFGIALEDRQKNSAPFQEALSKHCNFIKTRLGLHDVQDGQCSTSGVIILEVVGNDNDINTFENDLKAIEGVNIQKMVF